MKTKAISTFFAVSLVVSQGCSKNDSSDGATGGNPGGFVNRATEAEFFTKGDSMHAMLEGGSRLAPGSTKPTRRSLLQGGTFSIIESFATGNNVAAAPQNPIPGAPSSPTQTDCNFLDIGFGGPGNSPGNSSSTKGPLDDTELQIRENESCESSLGKIKSAYSSVLKTLPKQIAALRNAGSIPESCGIKVQKLDPNSETEAIGYEFTPKQTSEKINYGVQARGAADGDKVAVFLKMWAKVQTDAQPNGQGASSIDASGEFNTVGDLSVNSLQNNMNISLAMSVAEGSVSGSVSQSILAEGLGVTQLASIHEVSEINLQGSAENGESQTVHGTMTLQVTEVSSSTINISGEVASEGQTQKFKMTMTKASDGSCHVVGVNQQ